jgi:hypothetical protein
MDLTINERRIKLRQVKLEISPETILENGQDITILVHAQIVDLHSPINQDGTKDVVFVAKAMSSELQ